jgi:hypothetical protein
MIKVNDIKNGSLSQQTLSSVHLCTVKNLVLYVLNSYCILHNLMSLGIPNKCRLFLTCRVALNVCWKTLYHGVIRTIRSNY